HVEQDHVQLLSLLEVPAVVIERAVHGPVLQLVPRRRFPLLESTVCTRKIVARAKVLASALEDDHVYIDPRVRLKQRIAQFCQHSWMQRVALFWTIQSDARNTLLSVKQQVLRTPEILVHRYSIQLLEHPSISPILSW